MIKKYIAEFVGTFALSFAVLSAVSFSGDLPLVIPVIAALVLGLFVYTIGAISGSHINPAVTLGLLSVGKINVKESVGYIVSQIIGAGIAVLVAKAFFVVSLPPVAAFDMSAFFAEMLGAFFFTFGIASVVYGKVKDEVSGLVVGGSLLLGILVAVFAGSSGILNPAVALALSSASALYILAPIVGSIIGFNVYKKLAYESI